MIDQPCSIRLLNASETSYPDWAGYDVVASYDREDWFRVPTEFDGQQLSFDITPECNSIYFLLCTLLV